VRRKFASRRMARRYCDQGDEHTSAFSRCLTPDPSVREGIAGSLRSSIDVQYGFQERCDGGIAMRWPRYLQRGFAGGIFIDKNLKGTTARRHSIERPTTTTDHQCAQSAKCSVYRSRLSRFEQEAEEVIRVASALVLQHESLLAHRDEMPGPGLMVVLFVSRPPTGAQPN